MKYRDQDQGGDLFAFLNHQQQCSENKIGVARLTDLINWEGFRSELENILGYDNREASCGGRPPFDPVFMFKVLVLQKFHGLSDEATEFQITDRFSFLQFLGLRPGDDIPDKNTIWDFREALEKEGRDGTRRLFLRFESMLEEKGLIGREGSIVDASFVDAPRQRNSREENKEIKNGKRPEGFEENTAKGRQKDCEARWTKKNNETHYGYKNHAKVDAKSKLVDDYETTSANVHDSQVIKELVGDEDNAVLADKAYDSEEIDEHLLKHDCEEFILRKAKGNQSLSEEEKKTNRQRSKIRARVEHVFGRMSQMGMDRLRSIGLKRAHQHNGLSNLIYNMDRYAFLMRMA